jgi:hypothetical protein
MKYIIIFAISAALFTGCDETAGGKVADLKVDESSSKSSDEQMTTIQWIDSSKNYGTINEGQVLEVSFRFRNTGDKPLVIENVRPSCGCTAANPPDKPILPGEEGVINATFDSKSRPGKSSKEIYVTANTVNTKEHKLHFEVDVIGQKN